MWRAEVWYSHSGEGGHPGNIRGSALTLSNAGGPTLLQEPGFGSLWDRQSGQRGGGLWASGFSDSLWRSPAQPAHLPGLTTSSSFTVALWHLQLI